MSITELEIRAEHITSAISASRPGARHIHLTSLHGIVSEYALSGRAIPNHLRQLQEELTNEAMEARFDNLPV